MTDRNEKDATPETLDETLYDNRMWLTHEWGRWWVGCDHGRKRAGADPVRICQTCFDKLIQTARLNGTED